MDKCPVCKVGKLVVSGSHKFCTNCGFVLFDMDDNYFEAAAQMLGVLTSNCRYPTREAHMENCRKLIQLHMPMLDAFFQHVENGVEETFATLCDLVRAHAINCVIDSEQTEPEPEPDQLPEKAGLKLVRQTICEVCHEKPATVFTNNRHMCDTCANLFDPEG